jgi:methionyl-tRNA formyltransferase
LGSINILGSLLPELRGAAPVNWAIVRGYEKTGVTIMRMTAGMDEGPILVQRETPIEERETASDLYLRLAELGAEALLEAVVRLEVGDLPAREQDHARATYAPKIDRETARIDWKLSPLEVANHIRGMDEVPGAWTTLGDEPVKLFEPRLLSGEPEVAIDPSFLPGRLVAVDPIFGLLVVAGGSALGIEEIQPPGGRRMLAGEWLRGRKVPQGATFE